MNTSLPNIIFILADDLGYADLGCMGARMSIPVSPNLDRMAAEGMLFTHGYSNSPVCSPTRLALMTGRWQYRLRMGSEEPMRSGSRGDKILGLPPDHPTLPSMLGQRQYRTALVGKWHLGYPPAFGPQLSGYDVFYGSLSGGVDYFSHKDRQNNHDLWFGSEAVHDQGYLTDLISDAAIEFVSNQTPERPFFLSVHYTAPHWPWETRDDKAESNRIGDEIHHIDGGNRKTYEQMIREMDEGIGRILGMLQEKGLSQDTIVIFTSDNGGERYSDTWPFVGQKMDLLEGGIRVPLLVRWPRRFAGGQVSHTPSMTMDWTATLLSLAGASISQEYPLDGLDLSNLFDDPSWFPQRDLCWRMKHRGQRALRRGKWKYLRIDGIDYLFDVINDPRERANMAKREPALLSELRLAWEQWNQQLPEIPDEAKVSLAFTSEHLPHPTH